MAPKRSAGGVIAFKDGPYKKGLGQGYWIADFGLIERNSSISIFGASRP